MIHKIADKIVWLGHDAFRIDAGVILYFDPYELKSGPKADILLITHDHFDHFSASDVEKLVKPETVIVTEKDTAAKLKRKSTVLAPGETVRVGEISIEAVPAYNTDKEFHPRKNGWIGFIVEIDGVRIYHAGDTDFIPEMKTIRADIALLPVSGTYVMTAEQAVDAALAIRPALAIPMHYGAIVGGVRDALTFAAGLKGRVETRILEKQA